MSNFLLSAIKKNVADEDKRKVFVNFFYLSLERITQLVIIIIINRLLINHYDFGDFSSWQYSLVILAIFMTGTWICGAEMVIPKLLDAPSNINTTMSNVIILRLAAGTFVALCMVAWGFFAASVQTVHSWFGHICRITRNFHRWFNMVSKPGSSQITLSGTYVSCNN